MGARWTCKRCPWPHGQDVNAPLAKLHEMETGHELRVIYVTDDERKKL